MAVQSPKTRGRPGSAKETSSNAKLTSSPQLVPKVLRIGIIQSGKIVEERIIRKRDTVTVGQSEKNTFVIASQELPARFEMFENKGGGDYTLQFTENVQGRVSIKSDVKELSELRTSGVAQQRGRIYRLPLTEDARGKLVIGDSTILFQFVAPPPIQPRPQLPAAARGGLFRNLEWFITIMWVLSFIAETLFLIYLEVTDWPVISKWDRYLELQELITPAEATFEKKKVEKKEDGEGEGEEEEAEQGEEEKPKKKAKAPKAKDEGPKKSAAEIARERAEKRAALAEQLAQRGINKILGSISSTGDGAIVDVLRGGDVGADQDELLAQVQGVGVATGANSKLRGPAGGKGSGEAADISQLRMEGGDATVKTAGAGTERKVKGQVKRKNASAIDGTGSLNPQEVNKVIGRRMGAIKGCYERALRRDPNLKGKVIVRFTIAGSGKVSAARTVSNELTPEVGNCIVQAFKRFRFPQPDGGSLTLESPFLFMPSN